MIKYNDQKDDFSQIFLFVGKRYIFKKRVNPLTNKTQVVFKLFIFKDTQIQNIGKDSKRAKLCQEVNVQIQLDN